MPSLQLGLSTDLTQGFDPSWTPGDAAYNGLFQPPSQPLTPLDYTVVPAGNAWSFPLISIHDTAEDLLSALFPYRVVNPSDGVNEAEISAGALLIGDSDRAEALKKLSKTLGINQLGQSGFGYALVRLRHETGNAATHPSVVNGIVVHAHPLTPDPALQVNENFRKDLTNIRPSLNKVGQFDPEKMTADNARLCVRLFGTWGTHFISQIIVGEEIFQVFVYAADRYDKVKKAFRLNNFSGADAINFTQFTTDANTGAFGYVTAYSPILAMSGDATLSAAVKAGEWTDPHWSGGNSVFAPWLDNGKMNYETLAQKYTAAAPLTCDLTSLTVYAEFERRRAWKRVFKGVMIQKFEGAVIPHLETYFPYDLKTLIPPSDIPGLVSTIATPVINTYKPRLDLDDLQFAAPENAKSFTLCSNLLLSGDTGDPFFIPGTDIAFMAQEGVFESDKTYTKIVLTDQGFNNCQFSFGNFYGCMQVRNQSGSRHSTILDGLKYEFGKPGANGRNSVEINADLRSAPSDSLLRRMHDNVSFAYAFADSVLSGNPPVSDDDDAGPGIREFVVDTMQWIGKIIPATADMSMIDLRVRALDAVRMASNPQYGAFVPLLPPTAYQQQVNNILNYVDAITQQIREYQGKIDQRKQEELIMAVGNAINKNIIDSGQILSSFVQANAAQQKDLSNYYGAIISQKQAELSQAQTKIDSLQASLNEQQLAVKNAVDGYKSAVEAWKTQQSIQFGLDIATLLFSAATSVAIPAKSISAVKDLGLMVQRIQKLLNILNNSFKLYTTSKADHDGIKNANSALDELADADFDVNSNYGWDELNANMSLILNLGPSVAEKNILQNAFAILVLRGKALMSAKDSATTLARDVYNQQKLQALSDAQQVRLDKIKTSLQPANLPKLDPNSLDLIGMTGSLMFIRSQMLGILSKTFVLQDQALQYQNLQPATVITSFDLLSFRGAIVRQGQTTLTALTALNAIQPSTTTPIDIEVDIPVDQLTGGQYFALPITLDNGNFSQYVDVRVKSVMVKVDGITQTDSGRYQLKLVYNGWPFADRGIGGKSLFFRTPSRERNYEFDVATNKPKFTDGGTTWSQEVNAITPFSTWQISLPANKANKDIKFSDATVKVTLSFVLVARVDSSLANAFRRPNKRMLTSATVRQAPPIGDLLSSMANRSAVNGWDAVFNMTLAKIQEALNKQYDQLKSGTNYGGKINATSSSKQTSHITIYKKFDLQYGYPLLTFQANDTQNVLMHIPILSGSVTTGSQYDNNPIDWDPPVNANPDASISAVVPIGKVAGLVNAGTGDKNNILSVVLDLAQGTFLAKNMEINDDDNKAAFNQALINYFTANKVIFIINTLDLNKITTLEDLRPNQFVFKTLVTQTYKNQILQLFITTGSRKALDYSQAFINNVDEPIPMGSDCSLILSSKIFFNSVMPQSLSKQGWRLKPIDPNDPAKAWSAQFDQGSVSANVDLSPMNKTITSTGMYGSSATTYYTYDVPGGSVTLGIDGMTLTPASTRTHLAFSKSQRQTFVEHSKVCTMFCSNMPDRTLSSDYTMNIAADIPMSISGKGREQNIAFKITNQAVTITGHLSGGGPCGCDDIQAIFNQQLNGQLPGQVTKQINVSFTDVSIFALKNLLFPSDNFIDMNAVNIPGDLLITGTFTS